MALSPSALDNVTTYIATADAELPTLRAVQGIPVLDVPGFWATLEGVAR